MDGSATVGGILGLSLATGPSPLDPISGVDDAELIEFTPGPGSSGRLGARDDIGDWEGVTL